MTLLVTADDQGLPAMLRVGGALPGATFTTPAQLKAALEYKRGPMVLLLDEAQAQLVTSCPRTDVRAVVIVNPKKVPAVFTEPVMAVIERPLLGSRVVAAVRKALGSLESEPPPR
jgi:AmiR/NasT family two-component response regulator